MKYKNVWGTICDDFWDIEDAHVACHQLGYTRAVAYKGSAYYGQGSGPIHMDDMMCTGAETRLQDCDFNGWDSHNCKHSEDAGVICSEYSTCRGSGSLQIEDG